MHRQVNFGTHGFWSQCVVDKIVSFGLHKERRDFFPETDIFLWDHHKVSSSWTTMKSRCSMFTCKCRLLFKLPLDRPLFCDVIFCFFTSGTSIFLIFWEFSFIPRVLYCVRVSVLSFTVFLFSFLLSLCVNIIFLTLNLDSKFSDLVRTLTDVVWIPENFQRSLLEKKIAIVYSTPKKASISKWLFSARIHIHWHCMPLIHCLLCYSLTQITC